MKKIFLLSAGTLFFILFSISSYAQCTKDKSQTQASKSTSTEVVAVSQDAGYSQTVLNIDGMMCSKMCTEKISSAVKEIEGVAGVNIDFETKVATVSYDAEKTNAEAITQTITDTGYKVVSSTSTNAAIAPVDAKKSKKDCSKTCTKSKTKKSTL